MSKMITSPKLVFKINSARLRRSNWHIKLTVKQARENNELISMNESQILRWLDELNGIKNAEQSISYIKDKICTLKYNPDIKKTQREIKYWFDILDSLLFKQDYVCVIIDKAADYQTLYKDGFYINDICYRRLLGTTGGVKNSTIVFVNEKHLKELKKRIANGRDLTKEFSPAKLEAYQSLVCSASTPVSLPKGICVVPDCITHFKSDYILLDDTNVSQPKMIEKKAGEIELNDSDGYGLGMPSLMKRWGSELKENYILPGCVIRNSFLKGAVFCVDFQKFAAARNIKYIRDVWGAWHSVKNIELIVTTSMLKLWDSYPSIYVYLQNCKRNHYSFAITKAAEENLENERCMNYQFLQSYDFTDEDIEELIQPTISEIKDILSGDYRKTVLYTKGKDLNAKNVTHLDPSFSTALMIDERMKNDPYVKAQIQSMITKRINNAKVGVLTIPANYSLVSGDPYSLCQSMFGLPVTGLLKEKEAYCKYWNDQNAETIACFRAPMTCHNNIRLFHLAQGDEMDEFYQYMRTITIFNSWDTSSFAMNGLDHDGDCVINTNMPVIVRNTRELPAIICVQRKAPKCVPIEHDLMLSNLKSFGSAVGSITNKITNMFEVQSRFPPGSREYNLLNYRIKCGQLYQQNAIDKTKGIDSQPMPDSWFNWISNSIKKNENARNIISFSSKEKKNRVKNRSILADKKPYFMRYIYPAEDAKYRKYEKDTDNKCKMKFGMALSDLERKEEKTSEENAFLDFYYKNIPLGQGPCVTNRICRKIESHFDGMQKKGHTPFDYSILKSNASYDKKTQRRIEAVYKEYQSVSAKYMQEAKKNRIKPEEWKLQKYLLKDTFKRLCYEICPNEDILCDIILDLCYNTLSSKQFAWDICGPVFIKNLLRLNNYQISYPEKSENGDICFGGEHFRMATAAIPIPEISEKDFTKEDTDSYDS